MNLHELQLNTSDHMATAPAKASLLVENNRSLNRVLQFVNIGRPIVRPAKTSASSAIPVRNHWVHQGSVIQHCPQWSVQNPPCGCTSRPAMATDASVLVTPGSR